MSFHAVVLAEVVEVLPLLLGAAEPSDPTPEPEDVKAGWTGFAVFIGLVVAVAFLGWALTKQLKRAERNRAAGVFGPVDERSDEPVDRPLDQPFDGPGDPDAPGDPDGPGGSRLR